MDAMSKPGTRQEHQGAFAGDHVYIVSPAPTGGGLINRAAPCPAVHPDSTNARCLAVLYHLRSD